MSSSLEDRVVRLIRRTATCLPIDVENALKKAYETEENEIGKLMLQSMLRNAEISKREGLPLCQDTGSMTFYIKSERPSRTMDKVLTAATARATDEVPLRPNMVDAFTGENSGNNLGRYSPFIVWEPASTFGEIELTVLLKGAGSDNMTATAMLNPTDGIEGVERFILNRIVEAGGKPCPPTIIGIGIGGSSDVSLFLSKKALLREVGSRNTDAKAASLEKRLLAAINSTGIGPMGLGGKWTSLWVNVEHAHRHTASLPVAVSMACWALRRASMLIQESEILEMEQERKG